MLSLRNVNVALFLTKYERAGYFDRLGRDALDCARDDNENINSPRAFGLSKKQKLNVEMTVNVSKHC